VKISNDQLLVRILAATSIAAASAAHGQNAGASAPTVDDSAGALEEIVVTASGGDKSQLNSSVSVTAVSATVIENFHPSSEAEVFRMIPGIQVAGTAGPGGNSNIAVRGLPVATGGSPFVQIQEDGLPTVLFGDIQFGNNDYWTHFDSSVEKVEGVRGGSASTFASQAPGAVINYISKTGKTDGGYVQLNRGLGFDDNKIDFNYGGAGSDSVHYNVGGYVHNGRGPLDAGYNVSQSAQLKANLTKDLADGKGYIRFLVKLAKTQEPNYTGSPALVNLSGKTISDVQPYPGFDGRNQSNYSILNQSFLVVNRDGVLERTKMDGITTQALSLGSQLHYEFADQVSVDNNMRWTSMSGGFASPFLNTATTASVIGSVVNGGTVASVRYANGAKAGQVYAGRYLNNNTNVKTNIRDIGSFADDLALSGKFDLGGTKLTARAGLFFMNQKIAADWHTNKATSELSGNNPAMLDLYTASGAQLTANGIAGFNNNWGNCCARDYDLSYTDNAPYLALDFDLGRFDIDASTRFENIHASGWTIQGGPEFNTPVQGFINSTTGLAPTVQIPTMVANGAQENLDYNVNYKTWTLGGLFKATDNISLFVRASRGGRFNGDRQTVSGKINADGSLNQQGKTAAVDFVNQFEVGVKSRGNLGEGRYTAELTLLKGDFKQSTYELTATKCPGGAGGCVIDAKYQSTGAEIFATYSLKKFSLIANATYSKAEKEASGATSFTRADGMPDLIYTISSGYDVAEAVSLGANVTGQTSSIDGSGNEYPASMTFGGFLKYRPLKNLELGLTAYNLFNKFDLRGNGGVADGSVTPTVIGGAPALGRTVTGSIKLSF
jgi:outer membrane receptor protein involved in Fe transport